MFVIKREAEESIHIGDDIIVTVLSVTGNRVRIGITAPRATVVLREELVAQEPPVEPA